MLVWQLSPGAQSLSSAHVVPQDVPEHAKPPGHGTPIALSEQLPLPSHSVLVVTTPFTQLTAFEHEVPAG